MTEKKLRGFASLSPERRAEISSKGGKAAHAAGTAHQFTRAEAMEAGKKGGRAAKGKRSEVGGFAKTYEPPVDVRCEAELAADLDPDTQGHDFFPGGQKSAPVEEPKLIPAPQIFDPHGGGIADR